MGEALNIDVFQAIVFDIDGTLYDISDVIKLVYQTQISFVQEKTGMSVEAIEIFFRENSILPYKSENAKSATELFGKMGLDLEEWDEYKSKHFDVCAIDISKAICQETMVSMGQKHKLFAVTSNVIHNVFQVLNRLGISSNVFTEIYTSDNYRFKGPFQKKKGV